MVEAIDVEDVLIVESETTPGVCYAVVKLFFHNPFCTCPAYAYGQTRPCKHIKKHVHQLQNLSSSSYRSMKGY